jgi:hypothetical protein
VASCRRQRSCSSKWKHRLIKTRSASCNCLSSSTQTFFSRDARREWVMRHLMGFIFVFNCIEDIDMAAAKQHDVIKKG